MAHPIVYHPSGRALKLSEQNLPPQEVPMQRPIQVAPEELNGSDLVPVSNQYVGYGDMIAADEVTAMLARKSHAVRVRLASNIEFADLRNVQTLLIGAVTSRWTMEMQQVWRFRFTWTPGTRTVIVDTAVVHRCQGRRIGAGRLHSGMPHSQSIDRRLADGGGWIETIRDRSCRTPAGGSGAVGRDSAQAARRMGIEECTACIARASDSQYAGVAGRGGIVRVVKNVVDRRQNAIVCPTLTEPHRGSSVPYRSNSGHFCLDRTIRARPAFRCAEPEQDARVYRDRDRIAGAGNRRKHRHVHCDSRGHPGPVPLPGSRPPDERQCVGAARRELQLLLNRPVPGNRAAQCSVQRGNRLHVERRDLDGRGRASTAAWQSLHHEHVRPYGCGSVGWARHEPIGRGGGHRTRCCARLQVLATAIRRRPGRTGP